MSSPAKQPTPQLFFQTINAYQQSETCKLLRRFDPPLAPRLGPDSFRRRIDPPRHRRPRGAA